MSDYPYVLRAAGHVLKGKRCQLVEGDGLKSAYSQEVQVRFEDGFVAVVKRNHLRRGKGETNFVDETGSGESKLAANLHVNEGE